MVVVVTTVVKEVVAEKKDFFSGGFWPRPNLRCKRPALCHLKSVTDGHIAKG